MDGKFPDGMKGKLGALAVVLTAGEAIAAKYGWKKLNEKRNNIEKGVFNLDKWEEDYSGAVTRFEKLTKYHVELDQFYIFNSKLMERDVPNTFMCYYTPDKTLTWIKCYYWYKNPDYIYNPSCLEGFHPDKSEFIILDHTDESQQPDPLHTLKLCNLLIKSIEEDFLKLKNFFDLFCTICINKNQTGYFITEITQAFLNSKLLAWRFGKYICTGIGLPGLKVILDDSVYDDRYPKLLELKKALMFDPPTFDSYPFEVGNIRKDNRELFNQLILMEDIAKTYELKFEKISTKLKEMGKELTAVRFSDDINLRKAVCDQYIQNLQRIVAELDELGDVQEELKNLYE